MNSPTYAMPNILIVDDVNANLVLLTEIVRNAGYTARPVINAKQAVRAIEALPPSLIILDISMPEIDGFMFCSMLKKNANTRDIPVIFVSAMSSEEDKLKGLRIGAVDYITKPFHLEEVKLRINNHLRLYKMQQDLEAYNKKLHKIINEQIQKIYDGNKKLINAMVKLSTEGDPYELRHLDHISINCRLLSISLQLSPIFYEQITNNFIEAIEVASKLYRMEQKITDGPSILEVIYGENPQNEYLKMAIEIVKFQKESWDGNGYPQGVSGDDIPLSARIVSVIAEYENLAYPNDKDHQYSHEESIRMIQDKSGIIYDPNIIDILLKIQNQLKESHSTE